MAAALKDQFGPDVPVTIADMLGAVDPDFDADAFVAFCHDGYGQLELTPRARRIADAMARFLPGDRQRAISLLVESLGDARPGVDRPDLSTFVYLPHGYFIAEHGLDHFDVSMTANYELTRRFTAEFSIRPFLEHHRRPTLARLRQWADDPDVHVRRLVSEGTRPRLPWAPRLRAFQEDPSPVVELLELLKDDPEEYVRRSVANNLNDIAKDHPELAVGIAGRWWSDGGAHRRRLVRHGLRTLLKQGHPGALAVLGRGGASALVVGRASVEPRVVRIGGSVAIAVELHNPTDSSAGALADLRVHFVKANGATSPKVFKGAEVDVAPGSTVTVRRTVTVRQLSTRTHHPGVHAVDIQLNGVVVPIGTFEVIAGADAG